MKRCIIEREIRNCDKQYITKRGGNDIDSILALLQRIELNLFFIFLWSPTYDWHSTLKKTFIYFLSFRELYTGYTVRLRVISMPQQSYDLGNKSHKHKVNSFVLRFFEPLNKFCRYQETDLTNALPYYLWWAFIVQLHWYAYLCNLYLIDTKTFNVQ